jgi:hypothetical protein
MPGTQVRHILSSARRLRDMHLSTSFVEHSLRPGIAGRTPHAALVRARLCSKALHYSRRRQRNAHQPIASHM